MNSRTLFLIIMAVILVATFVILRSSKDLYKAVPMDLPKTVPSTAFEDWREYTSEANGFTVLFPGIPQQATDVVTDPKSQEKRKYNMYVSEKVNGNIFMVTVITFPTTKATSTPDALFDDLIADMLKADPKNKLVDKQNVSNGNQKSIEFSIQNDKFSTLCKAFIINRQLYLLSYIARNEYYDVKEFDHFIDSFTLKQPEKNAG